MNFLYIMTFITLSSFSQAATKCDLSEKDLSFLTPKSDNIASTFWQEERQGNETIKRLSIIYEDGSIALIKHRFCSTYAFEAAYYLEEAQKPESIDAIKQRLTDSLVYVAQQDNTRDKAIRRMMSELDEGGFDPNEIIGASHNGANSAYGDTSYSIIYYPINHSSLHSAAIFVEIGIGGVH